MKVIYRLNLRLCAGANSSVMLVDGIRCKWSCCCRDISSSSSSSRKPESSMGEDQLPSIQETTA